MRGSVVVLVGLAGCWAEQRVDDTFSDPEWAYLQTFRIDHLTPTPCSGRCEQIAELGRQLFFDPGYSSNKKVSCATCHDPADYFADAGKALSMGVGLTGRNVPGLVDLAYRGAFTWDGRSATMDDVLPIALGKNALDSNPTIVVDHINASYRATYDAVFSSGDVFTNVGFALATYEGQLRAGPSPFDRYLAGESDAITDDAKRGARLFIGKGLCSECHAGPLFADEGFYVTGVEQHGQVDAGKEGTGRFRTPALRHVALTPPYMHAGQHPTLRDVVEFYRWGGDNAGFVGEKDPRIVPLDLTDDDVDDLVAFLETLTGAPVEARWTVAP